MKWSGVEKQLFSSDSSGTGSDAVGMQASSPGYQGYMGAGLHFGDWTVDTQIDPRLFFDSPNFISGETRRMNTRISIVRPW